MSCGNNTYTQVFYSQEIALPLGNLNSIFSLYITRVLFMAMWRRLQSTASECSTSTSKQRFATRTKLLIFCFKLWHITFSHQNIKQLIGWKTNIESRLEKHHPLSLLTKELQIYLMQRYIKQYSDKVPLVILNINS